MGRNASTYAADAADRASVSALSVTTRILSVLSVPVHILFTSPEAGKILIGMDEKSVIVFDCVRIQSVSKSYLFRN